MKEEIERITETREFERITDTQAALRRYAASGVGSAAHASATADRAATIDRAAENVPFRARAAASSEDPDHAISCLEFAALQSRRVAALAALGSDPITLSQTSILPSQIQIFRELEYIGLALRAHAVACGPCAAIWFAALLYRSNHFSLGQRAKRDRHSRR